MYILWILFLIVSVILFIVFKKVDKLKNYKKIFYIGWFICAVVLLFLSFNNKATKNSLENYFNTYLGNASEVNEILSLLDIAPYKDNIALQTNSEPYSLTVYLKEDMSIVRIYQKLEKNALILFSLINNVDEIIFERNGVTYHYYYDDLKGLFSNNLRGISISSIENRYKTEFFNGMGIYMGVINEYSIIDESIACGENKEFLKTEEDINYYLKCSDITSIYLYKDNEKYSLQEKINEIAIENLLRTNLNIIKENVSFD